MDALRIPKRQGFFLDRNLLLQCPSWPEFCWNICGTEKWLNEWKQISNRTVWSCSYLQPNLFEWTSCNHDCGGTTNGIAPWQDWKQWTRLQRTATQDWTFARENLCFPICQQRLNFGWGQALWEKVCKDAKLCQTHDISTGQLMPQTRWTSMKLFSEVCSGNPASPDNWYLKAIIWSHVENIWSQVANAPFCLQYIPCRVPACRLRLQSILLPYAALLR